MSMNLIFRSGYGGFIDFPFQTPTALTFAVLNEGTIEGRLKLIENYLRTLELSEEEIYERMIPVKSLTWWSDLTLESI